MIPFNHYFQSVCHRCSQNAKWVNNKRIGINTPPKQSINKFSNLVCSNRQTMQRIVKIDYPLLFSTKKKERKKATTILHIITPFADRFPLYKIYYICTACVGFPRPLTVSSVCLSTRQPTTTKNESAKPRRKTYTNLLFNFLLALFLIMFNVFEMREAPRKTTSRREANEQAGDEGEGGKSQKKREIEMKKPFKQII